tara:strand:- start:8384 stop:9178 length:795 start_codon:yes stop_codon:yes gene_type:complete
MSGLATTDVAASLGDREVLSSVNFSAKPGEVVGLIGPNGVGKTTLLRILSGLLIPERGTVTLDDIPLATIPRAQRAKRIAYLPADAPVHWPLRVDRLVALGRIPHAGLWQPIDHTNTPTIDSAMKRTDVAHLAHRVISTLSSGERARVLIARALAVEPDVLLADEPVSSLDPYHQLQVMEMLQDVADDDRIVVAVLHDLTLAARFCDRIALIADGRIAHDGQPDVVLTSDVVQDAYGVETVTASTSAGEFVVPWRRMDSGSRST